MFRTFVTARFTFTIVVIEVTMAVVYALAYFIREFLSPAKSFFRKGF